MHRRELAPMYHASDHNPGGGVEGGSAGHREQLYATVNWGPESERAESVRPKNERPKSERPRSETEERGVRRGIGSLHIDFRNGQNLLPTYERVTSPALFLLVAIILRRTNLM